MRFSVSELKDGISMEQAQACSYSELVEILEWNDPNGLYSPDKITDECGTGAVLPTYNDLIHSMVNQEIILEA